MVREQLFVKGQQASCSVGRGERGRGRGRGRANGAVINYVEGVYKTVGGGSK